MIKKGLLLGVLILAILLTGSVGAVTYCCEKTTSNEWCQSVSSESLCSTTNNPITGEPFKKTAASCEATSYCKPGTCINLQEGTCMPNTAQIVCEANYGYWDTRAKSEIEQCQLGCCLIGDQAAFTTQIACNRMSALYSLQINWQPSINNELLCLASANPKTKGACVFTEGLVKTCELTTKKDCQDKAKSSAFAGVEFHAGFLCTAQELGTNCAKTKDTQCDDKDDVRFIDTCGNLANVYDSDKTTDEAYWTMIQEPACTDRNGKEGNKNSPNCGDCDYLFGSMCKKKSIGEGVDDGNYVCKDLDCKDYTGTYSGSFDYPHHGEVWCATDSKTSDPNSPGGTYFKLMCYNGEVTKEQCDATRQKVCHEKADEETGFMFANCKKNEWESCSSQNTNTSCNDAEKRDCIWISVDAGTSDTYYFSDAGLKNDDSSSAPDGLCLPRYQPGFNRDQEDNVIGGEICGLASSVCYVGTPLSGADCNVNNPDMNCSCLDKYDDDSNSYVWKDNLNAVCTQLGDCGSKVNYVGTFGYTYDDVVKKQRVGGEE